MEDGEHRPDGVDDLSEPGSGQFLLVLPASVLSQLHLAEGGGEEGAPDQLHQPMGHLLDHFLEEREK